MDLNAGGEISDRKIGTTPNALRNQQSVRIRTLLESLSSLPLDTELNKESAGGELAKCIRNNPERNERSNEKNRSTGKERKIKFGEV